MRSPRALLLLTLVGASGCGPARFRPPAPALPHAQLLLEVVYHQDLGSDLTEEVLIDGMRIPVPDELAPGRRWTRVVRVAPGAHELSFHAFFERADFVQDFERPQLPGCTPMRATAFTPNDCIMDRAPRPSSSWSWAIEAECTKQLQTVVAVGQLLKVSFHFYGHGQCEVDETFGAHGQSSAP
jgi:hypothetical protein